MALWGLPFAGEAPKIEGLKEETYGCLALLFGEDCDNGNGGKTRHLLLPETKDDGTEVRTPLRKPRGDDKAHGLNRAGFLETKAATLQSMLGLQGKAGQSQVVADAVGGVDKYSDLWGRDEPVMKRFRSVLGKGTDGRHELSELCGAHLRRWKRLEREWRKDITKPPSAENVRQTALIGDTVEAMAGHPLVRPLEDEGTRIDDDSTIALMNCQVCLAEGRPTARLANVRMMCGHAWCSDCFIQAAADTATTDGVSTKCPSCNTHRCLAVEVGPHIYTQKRELSVEPSVGSVSHNMLDLAAEAMKDEDKERLRDWNSKLQLGRSSRAGGWSESLRLFGELESSAEETVLLDQPGSHASKVLRAVALCHIAWARATPAVDKWLETGAAADFQAFEDAMKVFDEAAETIRGVQVKYNPWHTYREALFHVQKGYTYAMAGGRAAGLPRKKRVWRKSRQLLALAEGCHEKADGIMVKCEAEGSRAFALGHQGSIKYSLAGVGLISAPREDAGADATNAPKLNLEGAVEAFAQQLALYREQAPGESRDPNDLKRNTHFAVSDATRLNLVALRLSLGFWNLLLSRRAFLSGNEDAWARLEKEAAECYAGALDVVDERLSDAGQNEMPSGQGCNLGCFERIRSIIEKARNEKPELARIDEMLVEFSPLVTSNEVTMRDADAAEEPEESASDATDAGSLDEILCVGLDIFGWGKRDWNTYDVHAGEPAEGQQKPLKRHLGFAR
mmetsp:Transcript_34563/g.87271  ORF Transcript_34563/g.87271 Transcript_34563/m.87271 type:complete len:734 (+) Transcript_34563:77-2278(+)